MSYENLPEWAKEAQINMKIDEAFVPFQINEAKNLVLTLVKICENIDVFNEYAYNYKEIWMPLLRYVFVDDANYAYRKDYMKNCIRLVTKAVKEIE
jgi:hypothetical protein